MRRPSYILLSVILLVGTSCQGLRKPHIDRVVVAYPVAEKHSWNLDPSTASAEMDLKALAYTQAGLMQLTSNLDVEPRLVLPPTFTPNGKTVIFTLAPGVRWSDGIPLTAEHARDGLIRSLHQKPLSADAQAFRQLLPTSCAPSRVTSKEWEGCITVSGPTLRVEFSVAADLALPYFTQPFTFPQRPDILNSRAEKPYVTPSAYPSLGEYRITRHDPYSLDLDPISHAELKPIRVLQINPTPDFPTDFQRLLSTGEIHILESPPLSFVETSPWASSLQAHTDFNMVLLLQSTDPTHPSIAHVARSDKIREYIQAKGLPLAPNPSSLQPLVQSCTELLPTTVLHSEDQQEFAPYRQDPEDGHPDQRRRHRPPGSRLRLGSDRHRPIHLGIHGRQTAAGNALSYPVTSPASMTP